MKRNKKTNVEHRNIPHLEENIFLICLFYGFSGLNCILAGLCAVNPGESLDKVAIALGIIFLCMVPISFFDRRKGMCKMDSVILTGILHLFFSVAASYAFSAWWLMGVYAAEVLCAVFISVKWRKIRKWVKLKKRNKWQFP